jgi:hypothetical protein
MMRHIELKRRSILRVAGVSFVLLLAAAFGIARQTSAPEQAVAENPILPAGTPAITDTNRQFDEDWAKPDFIGVMNGIRFYDQDIDPPVPDKRCSEVREATRDEIEASPLNFIAGYIPGGMELTREEAAVCDGEVATIVKEYSVQDSRLRGDYRIISVKRQTYREPAIPRGAPADRLKAATVGGRPAVIQEPVIPKDRLYIYMHEQAETFWMVGGFNTELEEVRQFAEALR